jgi:hypothetical protein
MNFSEKANAMKPADLEEAKECSQPSAKEIEVPLAEPLKPETAVRPLVRRQYAAGIPLNDPNSVF